MCQRRNHRRASAIGRRARPACVLGRTRGAKMSESNKMAGSMTGGMTRTNRAILIAAFILLAAAIGYAIWRDSAPSAAGLPGETTAAPSDQLADLEARDRKSTRLNSSH